LPALVLLVACGGSSASQPPPETAGAPPPASAPVETRTGKSTPTDEPASPAVPTECADPSAAVCTPPGGFVDRLCARPHADLALALFAKATPFTRLYLRGTMDELSLDEEVLALRYHAQPKGGIQVGSGSGSYDVLRWDGTCSTAVDADMLTRARPARPRSAHLQWHRLSDRMQDALIAASEAVKKAHRRRGKECQGAMTGDVSAACVKADAALVAAIVDYVRGGGRLPPPPDTP
jgi:hypothetical protein